MCTWSYATTRATDKYEKESHQFKIELDNAKGLSDCSVAEQASIFYHRHASSNQMSSHAAISNDQNVLQQASLYRQCHSNMQN